MRRLDSTTLVVLISAGLGLFWFQRMCEDLLLVNNRREDLIAADLHSLLSRDEHQRQLVIKALLREDTQLQGAAGHGAGGANATAHPPPANVTGAAAGVAHSRGPGCKKILWFMGIRAEDATQMEYYRYLQVALLSAKHRSPSLLPHLVFDGAPNEVTAWFERQGGVVILHELSLESVLREAMDAGYQQPEWFRNRGAFLRMDIPFIFPQLLARYADDPGVEAQYFLYTDNDVIFTRDITTCSFQPPPLFTIGAEHERGHADNTGIMYVNADAFAAQRDDIVAHGVNHAWQFGAMDQGLMLDYMAATGQIIPVLPDVFNWKGYWGSDADVAIVHFHGPKPERCVPCLCAHPNDFWDACQEEQSCPDVYKWLFSQAPDGGMFFKQAMQQYHVLRWEAEHS